MSETPREREKREIAEFVAKNGVKTELDPENVEPRGRSDGRSHRRINEEKLKSKGNARRIAHGQLSPEYQGHTHVKRLQKQRPTWRPS